MHVHKVCECSAFPLETWMHISNYLDDWLIIARSRDVLAFYICPKLINILNRTTCSVLHWYFHEAPAVGCLPPKVRDIVIFTRVVLIIMCLWAV